MSAAEDSVAAVTVAPVAIPPRITEAFDALVAVLGSGGVLVGDCLEGTAPVAAAAVSSTRAVGGRAVEGMLVLLLDAGGTGGKAGRDVPAAADVAAEEEVEETDGD